MEEYFVNLSIGSVLFRRFGYGRVIIYYNNGDIIINIADNSDVTIPVSQKNSSVFLLRFSPLMPVLTAYCHLEQIDLERPPLKFIYKYIDTLWSADEG